MNVASKAILFGFTLATIGVPHLGAQEVGLIEEVRGDAYWKASARAQETRLNPKSHTGRILKSGEHVRCGRGGKLKLRVFGRVVIWRSSLWFPVPFSSQNASDRTRQIIEAYGRRGGGERGMGAIYSPASLSKVRPRTFAIRWNAKPESQTGVFVIREKSPSGIEIVREGIGRREQGYVRSKAARKALVEYRAGRGHGPLLLILLNDRKELARTEFFLVDAQEERLLTSELQSWNQEPPGIWRHLGRAKAFEDLEMFAEAADEYDSALRFAPEGIDLLQRAITAHQRTGNRLRELELMRQLSKPHERLPR